MVEYRRARSSADLLRREVTESTPPPSTPRIRGGETDGCPPVANRRRDAIHGVRSLPLIKRTRYIASLQSPEIGDPIIAALTRLAALLCAVCAALCAVAIVIGRAQPQPELLRALGYCDGMPCYMGIVPGKTTWDEAVEIVSGTHIVHVRAADFLAAHSTIEPFLNIQIRPYNDSFSVELWTEKASVSVGQVIAFMGTPCAINVQRWLPIYVFYPGMSFNFYQRTPGTDIAIQLNAAIESLGLYPEYKTCDDILLNEYPYIQMWHGFSNYFIHD
jgi:hypothetical protein